MACPPLQNPVAHHNREVEAIDLNRLNSCSRLAVSRRSGTNKVSDNQGVARSRLLTMRTKVGVFPILGRFSRTSFRDCRRTIREAIKIAAEHGPGESAKKLGIRRKTIETHSNHIKQKLGYAIAEELKRGARELFGTAARSPRRP